MPHVRITIAKRILFLFLALTALVWIGCGQSELTAKAYLLDACIVSGEKLDSMGEPVSYVHNGQEVKFCCKGCQGAFKKDPNKYLARLEGTAAETHQSLGHDHSGHDH